MNRPSWLYALIGLLTLLWAVGCAVERGQVYVKDGKRYGVTSQKTWRDRWWDYYERGASYADGEYWDDALADFTAATRQREQDQRRARTYGMHLIDYFPHREIGIIHYRRGDYSDAALELQMSIDGEPSAKAKFYLNKARKAVLQQSGQDLGPPRIVLQGIQDGWLTNRAQVTLAGFVEDDSYVAALAVNGRRRFIELAEPRLPFEQEVALHHGKNKIAIVADDLIGRRARRELIVVVDRHGPLVSLTRVDMVGAAPHRRLRIQGFISDDHRIARFTIAGQTAPLQNGSTWRFQQDIPLRPGKRVIPFEVEDAAGNVTHGEIDLQAWPSTMPPTREGRLWEWQSFPRLRWAMRLQEPATPVLADVSTLPAGAWLSARAQSTRPAIRIAHLADRDVVYVDTLYLEGRVTGASDLQAFSINGESLWRHPTRQLFFGHSIPLKLGENVLTLDATDTDGNQAQTVVVVIREERPVRQVGARLRVALLPFEHKGEGSTLSQVAPDYLSNALVNQRRFDFVERQRLDAILREHKLSRQSLADPALAAKTGKIATADGIVAGVVTETPQSLEVFARFVDVDSAVVLASEDVYGEDLTPSSMQTLMEGLAWKFRQRFPMLEGVIVDAEGKRLTTDLAESQGVKRYMKLIVFRSGKTLKHPRTGRLLRKPDTVLGEARIVAVTPDLSEAILLSTESGKVRELDMVITK